MATYFVGRRYDEGTEILAGPYKHLDDAKNHAIRVWKEDLSEEAPCVLLKEIATMRLEPDWDVYDN